MADYFCQFSCVLDVGSVESAEHADAIRGELAAELDRHEGAALGFEMDIDHETGSLSYRGSRHYAVHRLTQRMNT